MGTQSLSLTGIMDLDNSNKVISPGNHKRARNIVWRGVAGNMRAENAPGARNIPNTLPAGYNECIGLKYFEVIHQLVYFNYNSNGNHGIYIYDSLTGTISTLIQTGVSTVGDPLAFNLDTTITSIDIIFGDPAAGNLLFYVDCLGRPTKINMGRYLAGTYPAVERSFIDLAKAPPQMPLKCVYENEEGNSSVTTTALNVLKTNTTPLFTGGTSDLVVFTSFSASLFSSNSSKTQFTYTGGPTTVFTFAIVLAISYNQPGITTGVVLKNGTAIPGTARSYYVGYNYSTNFNQSVSVSLTTGDVISIQFTTTVAPTYTAQFFLTQTGSLLGTYQAASSSAAITVNNLRNSLFQFKYRFVYDDNEKSVWSSASIVPLPNQSYDTLTNNDYTLNSRISLFMSTGDITVKKIEVAMRQVKDGTVSDYYLVESLDKTTLLIPDNDIYWYKFYNGDNYTPIDIKESILLQSLVPQKAGCQAMLNGNTPAYANITEGYDPIVANMSVLAPADRGATYFFDYNGLLFFATVSGIDSGAQGTIMKVYLYGTGTNSGGSVVTLNNSAAYFNINAVNGSGTPIGISYLNSTDSTTVAAILAAVSAALVTNGFTQVSLVGNILTMSYPTAITLYSSGTGTTGTGFKSPTNALGAKFSYAYQSRQTIGVMYFDEKGRTNGTMISTGSKFQTAVDDGNQNMSPQLLINHRPPTWAKWFQVVRTANLSYNKMLNWVSNGAFSDYAANMLGVRYAYLEIDNIFQYNELISSTSGTVSYSFSPGDRVRIKQGFTADGSPTTLTTTYDYEILGTVNSIVVNGITKVGNFIKIYYPTADVDSYLRFDGEPNFQAYQLFIYNYAQHTGSSNDIYFEFGKCFGIGNPGTVNAFHIGLEQTQSVDLLTPAQITISNGDFFARKRKVPIMQTYKLTATAVSNGFVYVSPPLTVVGSPIVNTIYTVQNSALQQSNTLLGSYTSGDNFFLNNTANALTLRVRCKIPVTVNGPTATGLIFQSINSGGTFDETIALTPTSNVNNAAYDFEVDTTFIVKGNCRGHFVIVNQGQVVNQNVVAFEITLDVINYVTIPIIESSFNDVYNLDKNSNGRPSLVDVNAKQTTYSTLFRYAQPYQLGTNINQTNMFYDLNYDEFTKDFGAVIRMHVSERSVRIYQQRKVGVIGVYQKFIKNNTGNNQLIVADTIITPNNINYYDGATGIGNSPDSLCSNGYVDYFFDDVKGFWNRLSQDGIIQINEKYLAQYYLPPIIKQYATPVARPNGGVQKILAAFNPFEGECVGVFQSGTGYTGDVLTFNEKRNSFATFFDYQPDKIGCVNNDIVSFKNGQLYIHDDNGSSRNFYGVGSYPSVDLVFNENSVVKKDFGSIGYVAPQQSDNLTLPMVPIWEAPTIGDVETSLGLLSNLVYGDFDNREDYYYAAFWGASIGGQYGIVDGNYLHGLWLRVRLRCATYGPTYLSSPFVNYLLSQKVL